MSTDFLHFNDIQSHPKFDKYSIIHILIIFNQLISNNTSIIF